MCWYCTQAPRVERSDGILVDTLLERFEIFVLV